MPTYTTEGKLAGAIDSEDLDTARGYLQDMDMTEFLEGTLAEAVTFLQWDLRFDGVTWTVTANTSRKLTDTELRELSEWVSGQNSDGLGEGFEQQEWAWVDREDCGECDGCINWYSCDDEGGQMASFDWETNPCKFVQSA